jgi:type IV pilus assembly protein PilO
MMKLEDINNLPLYQKAIAFSLVVVILLAVFLYFLYIPKKSEITRLEGEVTKIQNEINVNMTKARRLEELKKENAELEHELVLKKQQLPSEAEVETLLKEVSELGLKVGLDFKLWRPETKKVNSSNLYVEIPVDVEIAGDYHLVAGFFDRVGKLPRIVNIENISMANPKLIRDREMLQIRFVATAFASYEPPKETEAEAGKKGAKGPGKKPAKRNNKKR